MAKKKSSKFNLIALVAFGLIVVSAIVTIVGFTVDWTSTTSEAVIVGSNTVKYKLSDLAEAYKKLGDHAPDAMKGFSAMKAFAVITLIAVLASAACYIVSSILSLKLFKLITALVGIATVVCAVVLIITTFSFCGNYQADFSLGNISVVSSKTSPAVGPWLMTVFGVIGGLATAGGAMKSK